MRTINGNVVLGCLSEKIFNMKNYRTKYFGHETFPI